MVVAQTMLVMQSKRPRDDEASEGSSDDGSDVSDEDNVWPKQANFDGTQMMLITANEFD